MPAFAEAAAPASVAAAPAVVVVVPSALPVGSATGDGGRACIDAAAGGA